MALVTFFLYMYMQIIQFNFGVKMLTIVISKKSYIVHFLIIKYCKVFEMKSFIMTVTHFVKKHRKRQKTLKI